MGQTVELLVVDDAAVAFEVVKKTEQIVDQLLVARGIALQLKQSGVEVFRVFPRLVREILQMPFAECRKRYGVFAGQRGNPFP